MTMEEMLKQNKDDYNRRLKEQRKIAKVEKIKETILFSLIAFFIIAISTALLIKMNDQAMNSCMEKGYSENICLKNL